MTIQRIPSEELVNQLHELADWVEKHNGVHCHSVPRKAAYTIAKLEEENYQMSLSLNKEPTVFRNYYDNYIGKLRLFIYLFLKNRRKSVKR